MNIEEIKENCYKTPKVVYSNVKVKSNRDVYNEKNYDSMDLDKRIKLKT